MHTTPEAHFITLCTRQDGAVDVNELRSAAMAVGDWDAAVETADRHRVAAFMQHAVTLHRLPISSSALVRLRQMTTVSRVWAMLLDSELVRAIDALSAAGLPVIVLKGPALCRSIYPIAALRPYADIDLTIQEAHEPAVAAALVACGFREIPCGHEEARRAHAGHIDEGAAFHRMFVAEASQAQIDLHVDPLQLGLKPVCEAERWQRAVPIPGLPKALMLSPEDQVVQLSVHAHKHGFDRLIWLKDLDLLLRTYARTLDWQLVRSVARSEGVEASVYYALHYAETLLRTPVPPVALARLRPAASMRLLYALVWPGGQITGLSGHMRRRAVQFLGADSWRGTLPNLILMGRRQTRLRATLHLLTHRAGRRNQPLATPQGHQSGKAKRLATKR